MDLVKRTEYKRFKEQLIIGKITEDGIAIATMLCEKMANSKWYDGELNLSLSYNKDKDFLEFLIYTPTYKVEDINRYSTILMNCISYIEAVKGGDIQ